MGGVTLLTVSAFAGALPLDFVENKIRGNILLEFFHLAIDIRPDAHTSSHRGHEGD